MVEDIQNFHASANANDFSIDRIINILLSVIVITAFIFEVLRRKKRKRQSKEENQDTDYFLDE